MKPQVRQSVFRNATPLGNNITGALRARKLITTASVDEAALFLRQPVRDTLYALHGAYCRPSDFMGAAVHAFHHDIARFGVAIPEGVQRALTAIDQKTNDANLLPAEPAIQPGPHARYNAKRDGLAGTYLHQVADAMHIGGRLTRIHSAEAPIDLFELSPLGLAFACSIISSSHWHATLDLHTTSQLLPGVMWRDSGNETTIIREALRLFAARPYRGNETAIAVEANTGQPSGIVVFRAKPNYPVPATPEQWEQLMTRPRFHAEARVAAQSAVQSGILLHMMSFQRSDRKEQAAFLTRLLQLGPWYARVLGGPAREYVTTMRDYVMNPRYSLGDFRRDRMARTS